jgi:hypothetical protein
MLVASTPLPDSLSGATHRPSADEHAAQKATGLEQ